MQIDAELDRYAVDEDGFLYWPAADKIEELKNIMKIKDDDCAVQRWWDEIGSNTKRKKLRRLLEPLWNMLCENNHYLYLYRSYQTDFTPLNDNIDLYNAQRLPFEMMCVRLMYQDQGKHILINEDLHDCLQHDENKEIFYRDTVLTAEEIAQLECDKWEKEMNEFKIKMDEFTRSLKEGENPFQNDSTD